MEKQPDSFSILAPAKINLTLEVLAKRPDGYHELRSVMQSLAFGDTISFSASSSPDIAFNSDNPEFDWRKSVIAKAADAVRNATGCNKGAKINLEKRMPLVSGLGGDSSCAAATLIGLNRLWQLNLPIKTLHQMASSIGSDVPYFLYKGTALMSGRGETITPLPGMKQEHVVLAFPDVKVPEGKTGKLYGALKPSFYTDGEITARLSDKIKKRERIERSMLFNVFESVASLCYHGIEDYTRAITEAGAESAHLCGAGPSLFSIVESKKEGEAILKRLEGEEVKCILTETLTSSPVE